jgi:hypothetical protein
MTIRRLTITAMILPILAICLATNAWAGKPALKFRTDGSFKIVQFTDVHDNREIDPRTVAAMNRVLDAEKPDFVVLTGDLVETYGCGTRDDLVHAIANIAKPIEAHDIPWAITLGNHDHDNLKGIGVSEYEMLAMYMKYPHNINKTSSKDVFGAGNADLLVNDPTSGKPAYGIWLIDSNAYTPGEINGQKINMYYDWVHFSQVKWYWDTSVALEKRCGKKIDSLMFFHIPLREYDDMRAAGKFTGEAEADLGPGVLNSGLFVAALGRGDVRGMFAGHAHNSDIVGNWYGIQLGCSGSIGYQGYGFGGAEQDRLRGARVFVIRESDTAHFETRFVTVDSLSGK